MADLYGELFAPPRSAPRERGRTGERVDTDALVRKIRAEAVRQGLADPDLAVAVAIKESGLKPWAWGDRGASLGLFQLQRAAAIDAGIDPDTRQDVDLNIEGGVRYLKQKLAQSKGNVAEALRRYNSGTPDFRGLGDPRYVDRALAIRQDLETPAAFAKYGAAGSSPLTNAAQRGDRTVRGLVTPASAEASPRMAGGAAVSPAAAPTRHPGRGQDLFNEFFGQAPGLGPSAPAVPTPALTTPAPPPEAPAPVAPAPSPVASAPPPTPGGLVAPYGTAPLPRSPALAAEQQHAAQRPWWQRGLQAAAEASPEIALMSPQLPQIEQARAEMTPAEREELRRQEGQSGAGADVGEIAGQMIGSAVLPGVGTAVGGTVGAVTGMTAETLAREGRVPTWKEIGTEAAWSAVPEVVESALRGIGRNVLRRLPGGQRIRFDEAARRARALPGLAFDPQGREEIGDAFEAVRQSGVQLDIGPMRQEIQALRPGKYADVMAEMRRMDQAQKTGGRYQQLVENLRQGGGVQVAGWPIGDLQQLRSGLRQRIDQLEHTEARQLLRDVQRSVDDAVDQGLARGRVGTGQTVDQLHEARRQWGRLRASEDLGDLIERTITATPDLSMASLNLRQLADALRRNSSDLAQGVNRALDQTPGARAAFQREVDAIARLYRTIELPMTDVAGLSRLPVVAALRQGLSSALLTETGQRLFRDAIVNGRGQLSLNALATAANAARRESGLAPLELFGGEERGSPAATTPAPPAAGR